MKFFSWLLTILIIAVIIAALTAPSEKKFHAFINTEKGGDTMSCKPIMEKISQVKVIFRISSVYRVSYCEIPKNPLKRLPAGLIRPDGKQDTVTAPGKSSYAVGKITGTETYLGLFGKFWKL